MYKSYASMSTTTHCYKRMTLNDFKEAVLSNKFVKQCLSALEYDNKILYQLYILSLETNGPDVMSDNLTCTRVGS